jgi:hypothetical protein
VSGEALNGGLDVRLNAGLTAEKNLVDESVQP